MGILALVDVKVCEVDEAGNQSRIGPPERRLNYRKRAPKERLGRGVRVLVGVPLSLIAEPRCHVEVSLRQARRRWMSETRSGGRLRIRRGGTACNVN